MFSLQGGVREKKKIEMKGGRGRLGLVAYPEEALHPLQAIDSPVKAVSHHPQPAAGHHEQPRKRGVTGLVTKCSFFFFLSSPLVFFGIPWYRCGNKDLLDCIYCRYCSGVP